MAGKPWTNEESWRLFRAGEIYDKQWAIVSRTENFGRSAEALRNKYQKMGGEDWVVPEGTEKLPLRVEEDPSVVAAEIKLIAKDPASRILIPDSMSDLVDIPDAGEYLREVNNDVDDIRHYDLVAGHFIFVINGKPLAIEYDRWDQICRDYSASGSDMTAAEIARKHGLPVSVLRKALTVYGHFKASPPFCRERVEDHSDDFTPLIKEAIENDEYRLLNELSEARDNEWKKDYKKLKAERLSQERFLGNAAMLLDGRNPVPPSYKIDVGGNSAKPMDGWFPTTDEHVGKYNWAKETFGDNLTVDISCERLRSHAEQCAEWVASGPPCHNLYRVLLGDFFHALLGETEHGTKLDQDTRSARVWVMALETMEYAIDILSQVSQKVIVKSALGNHDGFVLFQFLTALDRSFRDREDVEIDITPLKYNYARISRTLHVLDHGYGIGPISWKAKAQMDTVARMTASDDFHGADRVFYWIGDKHELTIGSHGPHQIIRLPTLGESDDYETSLRYTSIPVAYGFRLDESGAPGPSNVVWSK